MRVSEAVVARKTIRAFLDTPVPDDTIKLLLEKAARAPSGGNVQPWRIYVINGETMDRFKAHVSSQTDPETPAYAVYPQKLKEPYRSTRFKVGEDMYALLNIPREDRSARIRRLMENYQFFGAPASIFCFVDRQMGPPQWADLGMFLQTFMLLAQEQGLDTCPQDELLRAARLAVPGRRSLEPSPRGRGRRRWTRIESVRNAAGLLAWLALLWGQGRSDIRSVVDSDDRVVVCRS